MVPTSIPYNSLEGNGSITSFPFTFGIVETFDLLVLVDGILQIEYSTYTIENLTDVGGDIEFTDAPDSGAVVLILRKTTMTQQVDYVTGEPFQAETHEAELDKIVYILQELIGGAFAGIDSDGNPVYMTFDLDVEQGTVTVTVTNTGGTNAVIPAWESGTLAGVFHGELLLEAGVPTDESATTKPDGFIWLGY